MGSIMKRIALIVSTVFALLALVVPSGALALGVTAPHWHRASVATSVAPSVAYTGCKLLGGKRVLPCHPDMGVLSRIEVAASLPGTPRADLWTVLNPPDFVPEIELPPPRIG